MTGYRFRLYVLGGTDRTHRAMEQLGGLCRQRLGDDWDLEVVDVQARPEVADEARIVATPTLDRLTPAPPVRVVGDLSSDLLVAALELPPPCVPEGEP